MSTEAEPSLAGGFDPPSESQWLDLVDKVLKGAPRERLESTTPGGLTVGPLYTRTGATEGAGGPDEAGVPGEAPFVRGSVAASEEQAGWSVRSTLSAADPHAANRIALRELERGATELTVRFDAAFRNGVAPSDPRFAELAATDGVLVTSTDDLAAVLDGVFLELAPVHLDPGSQFTRAADLMIAVWDRRGLDARSVEGGLGADPIGFLAATGRLPQGLDAALDELAALTDRVATSHPLVRPIRVDTGAYVEAGASETQELAAMLATGAAYLRSMSVGGIDVDVACRAIEITLSADADVFLNIAKLRAARRLWAALAGACGASSAAQRPVIHVRTAERMMTRRDPWVNLLRVTAAVFAAGVGGARSVSSAAFDAELGEPDELGRRMARNTQLLLQEESNIGSVLDPAGGSWYVESLSSSIAEESWRVFGELESRGGLPDVLADGSFAAEIADVRDARLARVATRRDPITGVSEFADVAEEPVVRTEGDLRTLRSRAVNIKGAAAVHSAGTPTECEPLPKVRWAQEFERLRDSSDGYLAATGSRPRVFLANLGPVAVHTARASFATNFFAAGGIVAVTGARGSSVGYDDPADAIVDALAEGAHLVCLCSSDAVYADRAVEFAEALHAAGLSPVYLAGHPGDRRDAESAAGVSEFIHVGVDALEILRRAHEHIGTPASTTQASTRTTR